MCLIFGYMEGIYSKVRWNSGSFISITFDSKFMIT